MFASVITSIETLLYKFLSKHTWIFTKVEPLMLISSSFINSFSRKKWINRRNKNTKISTSFVWTSCHQHVCKVTDWAENMLLAWTCVVYDDLTIYNLVVVWIYYRDQMGRVSVRSYIKVTNLTFQCTYLKALATRYTTRIYMWSVGSLLQHHNIPRPIQCNRSDIKQLQKKKKENLRLING